MRTLLKWSAFDEHDDPDFEAECIRDETDRFVKHLFSLFNSFIMYVTIGRWDGPYDETVIISDEEQMKRLILQFDVFELTFEDEDVHIGEIQRYTKQWKRFVKKGTVVLRGWHHDGCNIYQIKPITEKDTTRGFKESELIW